MTIIALALAASAGIDLPPRVVSMEHTGGAVAVTYQGMIRVKTRDIGMTPPGRASTASTARCNWKVMLHVHREAGTQAATRPIEAREVATGSRHGGCLEGRSAIADEAARHREEAAAMMASVIERDRSILLAELDGIAEGRLATTEQRPSALQ